VLFINKSDLIPGTPPEVEAQARELYRPLIEALMRYSTQIDVRVFVGSASYGHSTHLLFSHFVEKILPRQAYDEQLSQQKKTDSALPRVPSMVAAVASAASSVARLGDTAPLPASRIPIGSGSTRGGG